MDAVNNSGEDDIDINIDDSDSEEIPLTAAEVIERMEEAWLNEKFAPEILPNKSEIVDCLLGQISYMEENLQNLSSNDFQKSLHQMEVDRLRFIITSYLRTRLEKIETYVFSIVKNEEERSENNQLLYLTDNELQFAKAYKGSLEQHFEELLRFWPGLGPDDWKKDPVVPNMSSFVFAKAKSAVEGVMLDEANDDEEALVDLQSGSQIIISYNSISQLVKNDEVCLI
ncbi:hypothetical protein ILUMI_22036 [Ignelater luminosus]|uniref:DNA replication complex GINS protein SLD5 n=1 Tax=Ignelater luminosus TaxID=2038154 RepID=A0A8K0CF64_IGNLU|nr:hypothetical protein ILUMI_22036 [Ignelater luminosus]